MENGFEIVAFAQLDEDTIIGVHPLIRGVTRATVFLAEYHAGKQYPTLSTVYTEEYDSFEELEKGNPSISLVF